ncbi:uncharacterized protein LOC111043755 [Nilaparvata lugens]|uniref:uncharacterized protein LOC111043755 n=1 Tax=Nilaparvata lugens TaxID=108931 RepID=UPI00193CA656|nr:uncharacterized protein LOC111043755 [Nilaparvata lugens]
MTCGCEEKALLKTMSRVLGNYPRVQPENRLSPAQDRDNAESAVIEWWGGETQIDRRNAGARGPDTRLLATDEAKKALIGLARSGVGAENTKPFYMMLLDWVYPHYTPILLHASHRSPRQCSSCSDNWCRTGRSMSSPNGQQGYLQLCAVWLLCELGRIQVIQR